MSTTVQVPGGTAVLRDKLTVRQRRPLVLASSSVSANLRQQIADASDDGQAEANLEVSEAEVEQMLRMQEAAVVVFLESWDLTDAAGQPLPLPTVETVGDYDAELFDVLSDAVAARGAAAINGIGDTGPDGITDPGSPTGPSSI